MLRPKPRVWNGVKSGVDSTSSAGEAALQTRNLHRPSLPPPSLEHKDNKSRGWLFLSPERRLLVSGLCGMMFLAVAGPALGTENRFNGVYIGKTILTKGSVPRCPADDDVSVTIYGETLKYTDSRLQNFVMGFYPRHDGSFRQSHIYEQGDFVNIDGRIVGDFIEADVTNPSCKHHWHLKKVSGR
jgi:hypothetical protein